MVDQINKLPEDGLKSSVKTSHYLEYGLVEKLK